MHLLCVLATEKSGVIGTGLDLWEYVPTSVQSPEQQETLFIKNFTSSPSLNKLGKEIKLFLKENKCEILS